MKNKTKAVFNALADVFNPTIPAFIVAGLSLGIANLLVQFFPRVEDIKVIGVIYHLLVMVNNSFTPFLTCWIGYLATKRFGGTPILGGMLGMMTNLAEIDQISSILNISTILYQGTGGVIAAFIGAFILSKVEIFFRKHMPSSLDMVLPPLISMAITVLPYILVVMPFAGAISSVLCLIMDKVSFTDSLVMNIIVGFIAAAIFLPINVAGLQHGIIALYPIQLEKYGFITLYPVFAMAGAGQVGAGMAIWFLSRKAKNKKLSNIAFSASIPGTMGVAGPLIYTVTLPHPKAFITSCLGAGIGGAFIKCFNIVSTGWGPSGLLALFMMDGPNGPINSMIVYLLGLVISAISGFLLSLVIIKPADLAE